MAKTTIRITKNKPGGLSVEPQTDMAMTAAQPIEKKRPLAVKHHGWCLFTPKGVPAPHTFGMTNDECWGRAYEFLRDHPSTPDMEQLWKMWKESKEYAKEKGWTIRKVWFTWEE